MKTATGTVEIKPNFFLTNPTMEVKGIQDALGENDEYLFTYIEIYFTEPNKTLTHSRYWEIVSGTTVEEFLVDNLTDFN